MYRLNELRKNKKITQKELADVIGVSKGAIGMYESGKRNPSLSRARTIAQYFGVALEEIEFGKSQNGEV